MNRVTAKKLAAKNGCTLWWDRNERMWILSHDSGTVDSEFIPSIALTSMSNDQFMRLYITAVLDRLG